MSYRKDMGLTLKCEKCGGTLEYAPELKTARLSLRVVPCIKCSKDTEIFKNNLKEFLK